jgi:hypothetical protein
MIGKREYNLLKTFKPSRWWQCLPATAERLLDDGLIEPTRFGFGNYQKTAKGRQAVKDFEQANKTE